MAILAKDVMTTPVISVKTDTTLKRAAEILDENSFSGMPVVDDNDYLIGIISESDILRYTQQIIGQPLRDPHQVFTKSKEVLHVDITHRGVEVIELVASTTVETLMTTEVISVSLNSPLYEIVRLIEEHGINRVPVVNENNKLEGIITRGNLVSAMLEKWDSINKA